MKLMPRHPALAVYVASCASAYCWGINNLGQLGMGRQVVPKGVDYEIVIALSTVRARVRRF